MTFFTYMYNSFIKPTDIIKNRNIKYNIFVYLISIFCLALATTLFAYNSTSIFLIILLSISMIVYFAITNIINVSILHFIVSLFYTYRTRQSVKTLLTDSLSMYKIFILMLPISLLLYILPSTMHKIFFILAFVFLYIYYIYYFCKVINVNIALENQSQAIFILIIVYIIPNIINTILTISGIIIFVNVATSFFS